MNSMKSVRVMRDYGPVRLAIISIFTMVVFFALFYGIFFDLHPHLQIERFRLSWFLISLIFVYPLHKIFHCLPLWLSGYRAKLALTTLPNRYPVLFCDWPGPISRNAAIISVAFPLIGITGLSFAAASMMPEVFPYISVIATINFGLSITDCIYISFLLKAPVDAYVEDFRDGFHILIRTFKS
ncbi:MAG TPA: DUF3267 domain-containing protein [Bacillales bacterium]|nr:DUF3267 domain-containing protein [Bacillales bacterium]